MSYIIGAFLAAVVVGVLEGLWKDSWREGLALFGYVLAIFALGFVALFIMVSIVLSMVEFLS